MANFLKKDYHIFPASSWLSCEVEQLVGNFVLIDSQHFLTVVKLCVSTGGLQAGREATAVAMLVREQRITLQIGVLIDLFILLVNGCPISQSKR